MSQGQPKKMEVREWALVRDDGDPYQAPELRPVHIHGSVYGHPTKPDGSRIMTSAIASTEGRTATTESGSEYTLAGPPRAQYVDAIAKLGRVYNPDNPFVAARIRE